MGRVHFMGIKITRNYDRSGATVNSNDTKERSSRNEVGDLRVSKWLQQAGVVGKWMET